MSRAAFKINRVTISGDTVAPLTSGQSAIRTTIAWMRCWTVRGRSSIPFAARGVISHARHVETL